MGADSPVDLGAVCHALRIPSLATGASTFTITLERVNNSGFRAVDVASGLHG